MKTQFYNELAVLSGTWILKNSSDFLCRRIGPLSEMKNRVRPWGLGSIGRALIPDRLNLYPADEGSCGETECGVAFGKSAQAGEFALRAEVRGQALWFVVVGRPPS